MTYPQGGFGQQPQHRPDVTVGADVIGISTAGTSTGPTPKLQDVALDNLVALHYKGITTMNTAHGRKEALACDYIVLTGPNTGQVVQESRVFNGKVIGMARNSIAAGNGFGGGVVKFEATGSQGRNPALIIEGANQEQAALITAGIVAAGWLTPEQVPSADPALVEQVR